MMLARERSRKFIKQELEARRGVRCGAVQGCFSRYLAYDIGTKGPIRMSAPASLPESARKI